MRIENIDPDREVPGAADDILRELERLGFRWDGRVVSQHARRDVYRAALTELRTRGLVYRCRCSRRTAGTGPYPGTCRDLGLPASTSGTWRLRVPEAELMLTDLLQGPYIQRLADECGDFVVWRADDWPAYHLAVVVDDAWQGITEVVRGADLLPSTPRQCWLQSCLGLPRPTYAHLPLVLDASGAKLSKDAGAVSVRGRAAGELLCRALRFLGVEAPGSLSAAPPSEILAWALLRWQLSAVPPDSRAVETGPSADHG